MKPSPKPSKKLTPEMIMTSRWARWLIGAEPDETIFEHIQEHGRAIRDFYLDLNDTSLVNDESPEQYDEKPQ